MLNENGYPDHSPLEDIGTTQEKALGKIIKQLHGTDFYSLTEFPAGVAPKFVRPFYTMLSPSNSDLTNSFDVFMRGEVRCSLLCLTLSMLCISPPDWPDMRLRISPCLEVSKCASDEVMIIGGILGMMSNVGNTVLALNIEAVGHHCWVLEAYLLGT